MSAKPKPKERAPLGAPGETSLAEVNVAAAWRPDFDRERDLCARLASHLPGILSILGLPPAVCVDREYVIGRRHVPCRREAGMVRADLLAWHEDGSVTVLEAKRACDQYGIAMATGQVLLYEQLLLDLEGATSVNKVVVIDGALYPAAFRMNERLGLGIRFVVAHHGGYAEAELRYGAQG